MHPTPDDRATDRLEQTLDGWGRAAGHEARTMPASLAGAVTARRHARRAQQGAALVALAAGALALGSWLLPAAPEPANDDPAIRAETLSPRLIDIQRANPTLDPDALRLPETNFGAPPDRPAPPPDPPTGAPPADGREAPESGSRTPRPS